MAKSEVPIDSLAHYLPSGAYSIVAEYLHRYGIHLTITRERQTVLGDYRPAMHGRAHRISVNGNLNSYAFLITLLHEMAHLLVFEQYGFKVASHGVEWKQTYSSLLAAFLQKDIFPGDIKSALAQTLRNPSASSCGEEVLMRVLQLYDQLPPDKVRVEQIEQGQHFKTPDGRVFLKGEKLRKRHRATELSTGNVYLFSGIYLVQKN
jgi:SprT protein